MIFSPFLFDDFRTNLCKAIKNGRMEIKTPDL
jgi:hypothetical protein